jgi:hypothetical protein
VAIVVSLGTATVVVAVQLFVSSLSSFFNLVLSGAGFFLLAEFFLDSLTATVFLTVGHRRLPDVNLQPHSHRLLLAGSVFASTVMGFLLVAFFIYGPKAIGNGVDQTFAVLLVLGLAFAWWTKRRSKNTYIFHGNDAAGPTEPINPAEPVTPVA